MIIYTILSINTVNATENINAIFTQIKLIMSTHNNRLLIGGKGRPYQPFVAQVDIAYCYDGWTPTTFGSIFALIWVLTNIKIFATLFFFSSFSTT